MNTDQAIACDLTALTTDQRARMETLSAELMAAVGGVRELPNGYALRLAVDALPLSTLAELIGLDRLCCPFGMHGLDVEPSGGPVWMRFMGNEEAKQYTEATFSPLVPRFYELVEEDKAQQLQAQDVAEEKAPVELACNMNALTPEQREQHGANAGALFAAVQDVQALANGYAFRFSGDAETLLQLAAFVHHERRCCPFFHFSIEDEFYGGPLWLKLTGPEGIKPFIAAEMGGLLIVELKLH